MKGTEIRAEDSAEIDAFCDSVWLEDGLAKASLASLRGKTLRYQDRDFGLDIPVLVTYHPAYLLRNLPDKAKAWEDLCRARGLMSSLCAEGNS